MMNLLGREKIYVLMLLFIVAVNLLSYGRVAKKQPEDKKAISSMTFNETGITEQKIKDYLTSDRPGARFFRYGATAGIFIFALSLFLNIVFILRGKKLPIKHEVHRGPVSWGVADLLRAGVIIIFLSYVLAFIESFIFKLFHVYLGLNMRMMINTFLIDITVAVVVFYSVMIKHRQKRGALGLKFSSFFRNILSGITAYIFILPLLLVVLLLSIMVSNRLGYNPPPQPVFEVFMEEKRSNVLLFLAVFVSMLGPIVEEVFFRGFMYNAIKKRLGMVSGILLSAALFSLLHTNIVGFLPIMLLGVLLAYLYETTDSLVPSITVHVIHNSIIVSFVFFIKELIG